MAVLPLFVVVPLVGAFLIGVAGRRFSSLGGGIAFFSALTTLGLALAGVYLVNLQREWIYAIGGWQPPVGISLVLDGLSAFLLVTVNLIAFLAVVFSLDYMKRFTGPWLFYTLFLLMLAGMNGVALTGDIFNLFVYLELASVASYALVAFGTGRHELEAAFKYAVMGTVGSLFILLGIVWLYAEFSTLNMADLAGYLGGRTDGGLVLVVTGLFFVGFGLKAAIVPFHAWLPDAHPSAPAPISAMLSGVLIKSLGLYALARVLFGVIGTNPRISDLLVYLGVASMIVGVVLALKQWDLKRLLAYHSVSQVGYIVLGLGLGTPLGIAGALFHLFNHSIFKSLLFLDSGSLEYATGTRDLRRMGGLEARLPVTGSTTMIASMSISGIPPFNGFWSKLLIIVAAVEAGRYWPAAWAIAASLLTLASFSKVLKYAFQGTLRGAGRDVREPTLLMQGSLIVLALICVVGGVLLLPPLWDAFLAPACEVLLGGTSGFEPAIEVAGEVAR